MNSTIPIPGEIDGRLLDKHIYIAQSMQGAKQLSKYETLWAKLFFKEYREIIAILFLKYYVGQDEAYENLYLVLQAQLREYVLASSLCSSLDCGKSHPQILAIALNTRSTGFVLEFLCGSC